MLDEERILDGSDILVREVKFCVKDKSIRLNNDFNAVSWYLSIEVFVYLLPFLWGNILEISLQTLIFFLFTSKNGSDLFELSDLRFFFYKVLSKRRLKIVE